MAIRRGLSEGVSGRQIAGALLIALVMVLLTMAGVGMGLAPDASSTASGQAAQEAPPSGATQAGPVDIGFAQDMSLHHEQALAMARLALTNGTPAVHALAHGIVNQQLKEIGYMQGWLLLWDAPGASDTDDMRWMRDAYVKTKRHDPVYEQFIESCMAGEGMPGMAKASEMEHLATLRQAAFDRTFLSMMIRHHQGAMVMARFVSEHAETEAVKGFARTIAAEQRREMAQMMSMLKAAVPRGTDT